MGGYIELKSEIPFDRNGRTGANPPRYLFGLFTE